MLFFGKKLKVEGAIHTNEAFCKNGVRLEILKSAKSENITFVFVHFTDSLTWVKELLNDAEIEYSLIEDAGSLSPAKIAKVVENNKVHIIPAVLLNKANCAFKTEISKIRKVDFISVELFPLSGLDQMIEDYCKALSKNGKLTFHTHLDSILLRLFDTNNIKGVLFNLGYKDGDVLSSKMLLNSLKRAQKKVSVKVNSNTPASCEKEWFEKNTDFLNEATS